MNTRYNTKAVVETGLIIAMMVVLLLIVGYIPMIGGVGLIILPIPITVIYLRNGLKFSIVAAIASCIIGMMQINPYLVLSSSVMSFIVGVTFGIGIKKGISVTKLLFTLGIALFIANMFDIMITSIFVYKMSLISIANMFNDSLKESYNFVASLNYENNVKNKEQIEQLGKIIKGLTPEVTLSYMLGSYIVGAFGAAYIDYIITKQILKKLKINIKEMVSFDKVYIDNRIGAIIIIFACIGMILKSRGFSIGIYIFNSTQVILCTMFILIGSAVVYYLLLNKLKMRKGIAILIVVFSIFLGPFMIIIMYIGFADMIFDYRRLDPNRLFKKKEV